MGEIHEVVHSCGHFENTTHSSGCVSTFVFGGHEYRPAARQRSRPDKRKKRGGFVKQLEKRP